MDGVSRQLSPVTASRAEDLVLGGSGSGDACFQALHVLAP